MNDEKRTYTYLRYMRDGSTRQMTGVIRSKKRAQPKP